MRTESPLFAPLFQEEAWEAWCNTPPVDVPETRYTRSGDVNIAYGVVGEGPLDLVFVAGWVISTLEYAWEGPPARFFRRLASFSRLILFDKRGTGLSDRVTGIPDLETRMDDVRAVMDAVGSKRAALLGVSEGGPMTLLFAATYPERTAAIVLYSTTPSYRRSAEMPWVWTPEEQLEAAARAERLWGTREYSDRMLRYFAPSIAGDEEVRRWWARFLRLSASPGAAASLTRMNMEIDVRHILPSIRVPTLIIHRSDDRVFGVRDGRYLRERIPGAEYVELPGKDHAWFADPEPIAAEVERFLRAIWERGEWNVVESDRVLATILFTDIVGSTAKAAALGDRAWRELLARHHAIVRRQLVRFRGHEIDTTGDGFFASFDGPARAIRCAHGITETVKELGIEVRAGLHTGECEQIDGQVGGIAVHIGARIAAEAQPGEVLVSSTVRDIVAGSGIRFLERGVFCTQGRAGRVAALCGRTEPWRLGRTR